MIVIGNRPLTAATVGGQFFCPFLEINYSNIADGSSSPNSSCTACNHCDTTVCVLSVQVQVVYSLIYYFSNHYKIAISENEK